MNKLNKLTLSHVDPNVILLKKQMQNILGGVYTCSFTYAGVTITGDCPGNSKDDCIGWCEQQYNGAASNCECG